DRHRADTDVPATAPATGRDCRPVGGHELDLDAETLADLVRHVDVEALVAAVGLELRLRRVLRIGRDDELAGLEDLVEQAASDGRCRGRGRSRLGRGGARWREARRARGRTAARGTRGENENGRGQQAGSRTGE